MSEFPEPPRRCPVCGGCMWRDLTKRVHRPDPHEPGAFEAVNVTVGQVCATCDDQQRGRARRTLETVRDHDPDANNMNHGY